jgi:hypothetical protein
MTTSSTYVSMEELGRVSEPKSDPGTKAVEDSMEATRIGCLEGLNKTDNH